jgi:hypothetical protein
MEKECQTSRQVCKELQMLTIGTSGFASSFRTTAVLQIVVRSTSFSAQTVPASLDTGNAITGTTAVMQAMKLTVDVQPMISPVATVVVFLDTGNVTMTTTAEISATKKGVSLILRLVSQIQR